MDLIPRPNTIWTSESDSLVFMEIFGFFDGRQQYAVFVIEPSSGYSAAITI